jgi:hypothetical protein
MILKPPPPRRPTGAASREDPAHDARIDRWLHAGVFFTFVPVGLLFTLIQSRPPSWSAALIIGACSGLIALGWERAMFTKQYWRLALVIPASIIITVWGFPILANLGLFNPGSGVPAFYRGLTVALGSIVCLALGYTFTIVYVQSRESLAAAAREELKVARRVHDTIVPPVDVSAGGLDVLGRSRPSADMGGDLVDAVASGGSCSVFLADVSGHGVGAGIVMGMLKSSIRTALRRTGTLEALVSDLNAVLTDLTEPGMFATFACVRSTAPGSAGERTLEYALAGHLPIVVVRRDGRGEDLANDSLPLGIDAGERFLAGSVRVAPGDLLALFTDGFTEAQGPDGREFGLPAVRAALRAAAGEPTLQRVHDAVLAAVERHTGRDAPHRDDQTLVLVRVN